MNSIFNRVSIRNYNDKKVEKKNRNVIFTRE